MSTTNQLPTPKGVIKTLTIFHYAYCIAILIFGTVSIFITKNGSINFTDTEDVFFYLVPAFAIILAFLSHFLYQQNLKKVREKSTLYEKLAQYQTSRIIRYAMLEAPALFGIVIYIITSNQFYLIISAVLLAYLFSLRPTKIIITEDLDLNSEQEREFDASLR
ncbi:hypothetical protein H8K90_12390 [Winogradskyella echinorum]|uniref:MFS transporter n=1 Tax=Winogradskyella echinorum TaxID=538189 RepID=A0ABR6Y365_9FLAO|nr:hypothetical protein [Winogradskyella echinorum]MBC3847186.1 hypothetical protein [Winogradskyella echinorum]MBC5751534.1 hypothetical protein [Winogradskyella echinorum]